jgi:hypothetical protein
MKTIINMIPWGHSSCDNDHGRHRRVEIPTVLSASQVFDDLPEATTVEGPHATTGCPGTATELNGVTGIGGEAATTCRDYYNVSGDTSAWGN